MKLGSKGAPVSVETFDVDPFGVDEDGGPKHLRRDSRDGTSTKELKRDKRYRRTIRRRRIVAVLVVLIVAATPVWISLGSALTNPSLGPSVPARLAEWTRDHGGARFVTWAENLWYSHHAPKVGGTPAPGAIPSASKVQQLRGRDILPTPAAIVPIAAHPIAGEGQWHPIGRPVHGSPAMYEAFLRPDPIHTSTVVGVVWMDTKLLSMRLYSGSYIPGGGPYKYTAPISHHASRTLVAAFNAGFREKDALGGYYTDHKTVIPLRTGAASMVIDKNGDANVVAWKPSMMTKNVASVRQNLNLLVTHGKSVPGLNPNDTTQWGYTLGNQVYVWRSGLGITKNGALVYVGGPGLNITTLANLLVRAGAVRAMELDINSAWVSFSSFKPSSPTGLATPANGTNLIDTMAYPPSHYFDPAWARDFFTASAR